MICRSLLSGWFRSRTHEKRGAAPFRSALRLIQCAILAALCFAHPASAQLALPVSTVQTVNAIEEDWEFEVGDPNSDEILPQIFVVTSPRGDLTGKHAVFEINNLLLPDFYGGGLQFQTWDGDVAIGEKHHDNFSALATSGEQVKFTVRMQTKDGKVQFQIKDGESSTWGAFGQDSALSLAHSTDLVDLSGYSPDTSVRYSRVGFGGNRVNRLVLKVVRYYADTTLLLTDSNERDVLQALQVVAP